MKYKILLGVYFLNLVAYFLNFMPRPHEKTLTPSTECVYDEWRKEGSCVIPDDVTKCTTGVGNQKRVKRVLTQSTGRFQRCEDQHDTQECTDFSQCELLSDWKNINLQIKYPNSLLSYVGSTKIDTTQSSDLNTCTYHCDEQGANMAVMSDTPEPLKNTGVLSSSIPLIDSDLKAGRPRINNPLEPFEQQKSQENNCTCWTLAGDINSVLKIDRENPSYVYDEDNHTLMKQQGSDENDNNDANDENKISNGGLVNGISVKNMAPMF